MVVVHFILHITGDRSCARERSEAPPTSLLHTSTTRGPSARGVGCIACTVKQLEKKKKNEKIRSEQLFLFFSSILRFSKM